MAIDIVYDRPVDIAAAEDAWSRISLQSNDPTEKTSGKKYADAGTEGALEALGFPKVPDMTASEQAAGQMDGLLRNWDGKAFSEAQMQQIAQSIRDGVYGCNDPCAVQRKLKEIQIELNSYLKGDETPFRPSASSTQMEVWLAVDNESQIYMAVRNREIKQGAGFVFPLAEGKEPKFQPL